MPISRELQLARQKSLHRRAPLVRVMWISFVLTLNVFRFELPEGGILSIFLEPARSCTSYESSESSNHRVIFSLP